MYTRVLLILVVAAMLIALGATIERHWKVIPLQLEMAKSDLAAATATGEYVQFSQTKIYDLENQHEKDIGIVNAIHSRPAVRVFLPCAESGGGETTAASGVAVSTESARLLSERNQQALDRFKQRLDDLQYQADTDIEACRVIQAAANATCWSIVNQLSQGAQP